MSEASEQEKQEYSELVKEATPVHSLGAQMLKAFLTGGIICCAGQGILNYAERLGLEKDAAGAWCSVLLVLANTHYDGRLRQQRGGPCHRVPEGGTGLRHRLQDFHDSRSGDSVRHGGQLAAGADLLGIENDRDLKKRIAFFHVLH